MLILVNSVADPQGLDADLLFGKLSPKLHKMKEIGPRGRASLTPILDTPMDVVVVLEWGRW